MNNPALIPPATIRRDSDGVSSLMFSDDTIITPSAIPIWRSNSYFPQPDAPYSEEIRVNS